MVQAWILAWAVGAWIPAWEAQVLTPPLALQIAPPLAETALAGLRVATKSPGP